MLNKKNTYKNSWVLAVVMVYNMPEKGRILVQKAIHTYLKLAPPRTLTPPLTTSLGLLAGALSVKISPLT